MREVYVCLGLPLRRRIFGNRGPLYGAERNVGQMLCITLQRMEDRRHILPTDPTLQLAKTHKPRTKF